MGLEPTTTGITIPFTSIFHAGFKAIFSKTKGLSLLKFPLMIF